MADKIIFDLVTPERLLFSESAEMVTIPGREGDMGVMAGHMPLISTLRPGTITVSGGANGDEAYFVAGGFAEVTAEKVTVLAEDAAALNELDAAGIDKRLRAAELGAAEAKTELSQAKAQELVDALKGLHPAA